MLDTAVLVTMATVGQSIKGMVVRHMMDMVVRSIKDLVALNTMATVGQNIKDMAV